MWSFYLIWLDLLAILAAFTHGSWNSDVNSNRLCTPTAIYGTPHVWHWGKSALQVLTVNNISLNKTVTLKCNDKVCLNHKSILARNSQRTALTTSFLNSPITTLSCGIDSAVKVFCLPLFLDADHCHILGTAVAKHPSNPSDIRQLYSASIGWQTYMLSHQIPFSRADWVRSNLILPAVPKCHTVTLTSDPCIPYLPQLF